MKRKGNGKDKGAALQAETVKLSQLKPHPRNYRQHPEDQLAHIVASIRAHGFYRNIVTARDLTILAGHGVAAAAKLAGQEEVPVVRLPLDPDDPRALRLLAGDNEVGRLAEVDDRVLTDMLRELSKADGGLLGTGYDEQMLAALAMVTRTVGEIEDFDAAAHWVGMPGFEPGSKAWAFQLYCESEDDLKAVMRKLGLSERNVKKFKQRWSARFPPRDRDDIASVRVAPGS